MSNASFEIKNFMTEGPHAIEPHEPLSVARDRMRHLKVLHLPVRAAGRAVGILSARDVDLMAGTYDRAGRSEDFARTPVADVMTPDPFTVRPESPLSYVASQMAERKIGSALVVDGDGRLLGIFTANDALEALATLSGGRS